jgi:branched-chain amino acid transport system ATP-binding protein
MAILQVKGLTKEFGGLVAVDHLDLEMNKGEILGLIGPNGAGKSTVFNVISGYFKPSAGKVFFKGEDITGLRMDKIASIGLVRTFQHTLLYSDLTVRENVLAGLHLHYKSGLFDALFGFRTAHKRTELERRATELMEVLGLATRSNERSGDLPHGYQRLLGMAIALSSNNPDMIMLDEPVTGMNAEETASTMSMIRRIKQEMGITVLLVEHNMKAVMELCERIIVLNYGKKIAEGSPKEIRQNIAVIEAYLGTKANAT